MLCSPGLQGELLPNYRAGRCSGPSQGSSGEWRPLAQQGITADRCPRVHRYPAKMAEHTHTTLAYLPTEIALALAAEPALAAEAVAAFYEREPRTLKVRAYADSHQYRRGADYFCLYSPATP